MHRQRAVGARELREGPALVYGERRRLPVCLRG